MLCHVCWLAALIRRSNIFSRQNQQNFLPSQICNSHLSPLRGQGIVRQVVVAAGVKVDAPRCKSGVLKPTPLPDDASECCGAFPLLSKPALHPSALLALHSAQTLSQLAVSHLQRISSLAIFRKLCFESEMHKHGFSFFCCMNRERER